MTIRTLPTLQNDALKDRRWSMRSDAIERFEASIRAKSTPENSINIYGSIGNDPWDDNSVSLADVSARLDEIPGAEIYVNINSPGGSFFDGVGIYNLLNSSEKKVTTRILGTAASAASVIAMAGDDIQIAESASMMIHKAWGLAIGNADDYRAAADVLDGFDQTMAELYAKHMSDKPEDILAMMAKDTWFNSKAAIQAGLADSFLGDEEVQRDDAAASSDAAVRADMLLETALMTAYPDMTRSERRTLRRDMKDGKSSAAVTVKPRADEAAAGFLDLAAFIRS